MTPALADIFAQIPGGSIRVLPGGGVLYIDTSRSPEAPAPTLRREAPWRYQPVRGGPR